MRTASDVGAAGVALRVVRRADDREVDSVDDIRSAVARAQGSRTRAVLLEVLRDGRRQELDLRWE